MADQIFGATDRAPDLTETHSDDVQAARAALISVSDLITGATEKLSHWQQPGNPAPTRTELNHLAVNLKSVRSTHTAALTSYNAGDDEGDTDGVALEILDDIENWCDSCDEIITEWFAILDNRSPDSLLIEELIDFSNRLKEDMQI